MRILFICFQFFFAILSNAQIVLVGQWSRDELLRMQQLIGQLDAAQSLTARPFFNAKLSDTLAILPASISVKFNSHHPYGWNDAGMIMAKGLQTAVSAGVYAKVTSPRKNGLM